MKSKMKRVFIIGMAGLMVLGGGVFAFADDVEAEPTERTARVMMRKGTGRENLKEYISGLSEDIQDQLKELKTSSVENRQLAKEIVGVDGVMSGGKKAVNAAEKFDRQFEGKIDKLRENHPDMAEGLEEKFDDLKDEAKAVREELSDQREAAKEERQERIEELKEEYPDEYADLAGNREELKELRQELREAIIEGDEGEIEELIDQMMVLIEDNHEILESVSDSQE